MRLHLIIELKVDFMGIISMPRFIALIVDHLLNRSGISTALYL